MLGVDLFAEIIPGRSAAGFELGMDVGDIGDVVNQARHWKRSDGQLGLAVLHEPGWLFASLPEISGKESSDLGGIYFYGSGAVEMKFNSSGVLEWIAVGEGYKGKLMGVVGVGDKLQQVVNIFDLVYDDVEELHFPIDESNISGIMFQAEEVALEKLPDQAIHRIIINPD